jgi:hypothetical protein
MRSRSTGAQWLAASLARHGEEISVAVVIACVALAIAVAVIFVVWALMQGNRRVLLADFKDEVHLAGKKFDFQLEQLKASQQNYDEAVKSHTTMRDRAQAQFLTVDDDAHRVDRRLSELERYAKRTLEHLAAAGAKPVILRGGLYVEQLAVLDIVLELVDKFLVAIDADVMYRQDDGPDGTMFYLRWLMDKVPRDVLDSLTRAAHGDNEGSQPSPGTDELRAVLEALRDGGLGVLYLGPLMLLRTQTCIQAGYLPPSFHCLTEDQKRNTVKGTGPNLMADLGVAVFLEFKQ